MTAPRPGGELPRRVATLIGIVAVCAGLVLPWLFPLWRQDDPAPPPASVSGRQPKADPEPTEGPPDLSPLDASGSLLRLYAATLVVLGLGVGGMYLYRRRLANWAPGQTPGQMEVMGSVRIDSRSHVVLVRARGQRLLAGVDLGGLKFLVPVPPGAAPDGPSTSEAPRPAA